MVTFGVKNIVFLGWGESRWHRARGDARGVRIGLSERYATGSTASIGAVNVLWVDIAWPSCGKEGGGWLGGLNDCHAVRKRARKSPRTLDTSQGAPPRHVLVG